MQSASLRVAACSLVFMSVPHHSIETENHIAHATSLDGRSRACIPPGDQKAEGMAGTKGDAGKESPLLAPDPVVVLDIIRVGEKGIKRECGERVDVKVPGQRDSQTGLRDLRRLDGHKRPVNRFIGQYAFLADSDRRRT
jgi:hypothetical protein